MEVEQSGGCTQLADGGCSKVTVVVDSCHSRHLVTLKALLTEALVTNQL